MPQAVLSPRADVSPRSQRGGTSFVALGLALGVLWFVCCRHLSAEWRFNEQYSYGWFVPFFALYLFWLRWEDRPEVGGRRSEVGKGMAIALIFLSALILLPLRVFEIASSDYRPLGWLHAMAAVAITLSILYLIGGILWVRHFSFPVLFFLTAVPWLTVIEGPIIEGLMRGIAGLAAETLSLFGVPAQAEGNLLRLPSGVVGVNEACSGVRSLQTSIMIGLLFGELKRLRAWPRLWLVVTSVGIALFANFLRVLFLVNIASLAHDVSAVDRWHDFAGYGILLLVFGGTMWAAASFAKAEGERRKDEEDGTAGLSTGGTSSVSSQTSRPIHGAFEKEDDPIREPGDMEGNGDGTEPVPPVRNPVFSVSALQRCSILLLLWFLAVEAGAELWYRAHERNLTASPAWTVRWPENAPGYREIKPDERVRQLLRYDFAREASWRPIDRAGTDYLFFFRWNAGSGTILRARAHRPDICLPSAGWQQIGRDEVKTFSVGADRVLPFRHFTFANANAQNLRAHAYYCLHEDRIHRTEADANAQAGLYSNWDLADRWRVVRNGIRNLGQQVMEVIILAPADMSDEAADGRFGELLTQLVNG